MKITRHIKAKEYSGCVLSIGNFDGFHLGHQQIIRNICIEGYIRKLPTVVMIFEPHPKEFLFQDKAPVRLTKLKEKLKYFKQAGVDETICTKFNKHFSMIDAGKFILEILVKQLKIKYINIGYDFKFGFKKLGDIHLLKKFSKKFGFKVQSTKKITVKGKCVSSTIVRQALFNNQLNNVYDYLGRPYSFAGKVIVGRNIGRSIGFPTANISLKKYRTNINGVYIVLVYYAGEKLLPGIANIGNSPTFDLKEKTLEVHILNLKRNLYGSYIEVFLVNKIRKEKKFVSIIELKKQILKDIKYTKKYFNTTF